MSDIKPGQSYRRFYNEGDPNNGVIHIRAIVDDEYVVYRERGHSSGVWLYRLKPMFAIEDSLLTGVLTKLERTGGTE